MALVLGAALSAVDDRLGQLLSAGGARADGLASAICALVVEGGRLGELEERPMVGVDGHVRLVKVPPAIWFERLVKAAERGAFAKMPVRTIVERILTPPDEAAKT